MYSVIICAKTTAPPIQPLRLRYETSPAPRTLPPALSLLYSIPLYGPTMTE